MTLRPALAIRALLSLALVSTAAGAGAQGDSKVLNIYNWSDYIADETIRNFEKETGIKVRYDNYDANEILQAKLVAGKSGYDIVVPSAHFAKTQIQGGLFQKLDRSLLSNWGNLDTALLEKLADVDPGNQHLVTWMWGYTTVGINVGKVAAALGTMPMPA
ncbi:MAG: extracellular solute-binding protein, partial [Chitinophagaceae bacterium]|nr:extracellular solute-binding protein [Rubrivivax sp.]